MQSRMGNGPIGGTFTRHGLWDRFVDPATVWSCMHLQLDKCGHNWLVSVGLVVKHKYLISAAHLGLK